MPPNDIELRVAYCTGRFKDTGVDTAAIPEALRASAEKTIAEVRVAMGKYEAYLMPRLRYLDMDAIMAAMHQGELARDRVQQDCADANSDQCKRTSADIKDCREAAFLPF